MSFQATVGTWFAAHLVTQTPIGSRFGLNADTTAAEIQFETGDALDDVVVRLVGGGALYLQCKTRPTLERTPDSALAKTLAQCVAFLVQQRSTNTVPNPERVATVLAVAEDAAGSLNALERACRQFDTGEAWSSVFGRVSQSEQDALEVFKAHTALAWLAQTGAAIADADLAQLAQLFQVQRFGERPGSTDWREISRLLSSRLYNGDPFGEKPTHALLQIVRGMIRSGAAAHAAGLTRALRSAGYGPTRAPGFDRDIAALERYSREECDRLSRHAVLEADAPVPLRRECLPHLKTAIEGGSLLVIGEPGAGKTGVLVSLAQELRQQTSPFVFLSMDRLAGITKLSDLNSELKIQHDLLEVLAAWPGDNPGVLIIDALDASRGGPSEGVFASFIELALPKIGDRWSVVASIRTFDLLNGRRFAEVMRGAPPASNYALAGGLGQVRHFLIKQLVEAELEQIRELAPKLGELLDTPSTALSELLLNVFNLSLAADLVKRGISAQGMRGVATQSELIDRYEDQRLPTHAAKRAVAAAVAVMVTRRRITVPQIAIDHDAVDDVLRAGVLTQAGDLVGFAHHVIFDHVAGRFYLDWNDVDTLARQVSGDSGVGLLLGPALRFAMERIWTQDDLHRTHSWTLLKALCVSTQVDPIVTSIAIRVLVDRAVNEDDIQGLIETLTAEPNRALAGSVLSRLARFVGMKINHASTTSVARAWSSVAQAAADTNDGYFADGARVLLLILADRSNLDHPDAIQPFGAASRSLLRLAWSMQPYPLAIAMVGIRCVARSYGSAPNPSRELLQQVLDESRFSEYAYTEAPTLAENIQFIIPHDPTFVAQIYAILFGRQAPQEGKSWLGGQPSRILPLIISQKQQYEHAYWALNRHIELFLREAPTQAITAVIGAVRGAALAQARAPNILSLLVGGRTVRVIDEIQSLQEWHRVPGRPGHSSDETVLIAFVKFLTDTSVECFRQAVQSAIELETTASIWGRILRIASERPPIADELIWPIASLPAFACIRGLARDAIFYLTARYADRPVPERERFETAALMADLPDSPDRNWWRSLLARWLSGVPEEALATEAMRAFRFLLLSEGRLVGNRPFVTIQSGFSPVQDVTDVFLEHDGVDLAKEPERSLRTAAKALEEVVKQGRGSNPPAEVSTLWSQTLQLLALIEREDESTVHRQLLHSVWGAISEAVEQISRSDSYVPETPGHPSLKEILGLNARLAQSRFPELDTLSNEDEGGLLAWGNWDVRVNAAAAAMHFAQRFGGDVPDALHALAPFLRDPVLAVRLQIAQSINGLWDIARERMWALAETIAEDEPNASVLACFISGPLARIVRADALQTERLLSRVLDRMLERYPGDSAPHAFCDAVGGLFAWLYIAVDNANAWARFERWTQDFPSAYPYLWAVTNGLRGPLLFGYRQPVEPKQIELRGRAQRILECIVDVAANAKTRAQTRLQGNTLPEDERAQLIALYQAGDRLLDHACNEFYFGSGTFERGGEDPPALVTVSEKQAFLRDYQKVLDQLGRQGSAHTIYHLIELYEFLIDAAPADVFDQIAVLLTGPAVAENYQFESLGAQALVSLVKRYLADYREIFENSKRRNELVSVLEVFSSAGWGEALKLLYELPDVLR